MRTPWQRNRGQDHDWVSGQQARCRDGLLKLNRQYRDRTGQDYYLYTSRPGDGQTRVVFTDATCQGYAAGLRHMQAHIALRTGVMIMSTEADNLRREMVQSGQPAAEAEIAAGFDPDPDETWIEET